MTPSLRESGAHLASPHQVPGGVIISSSSSSVLSRSALGRCRSLVRGRELDGDVGTGPAPACRTPSFSARRAAAQAHSNVRRFLPNSTNSRAGGLFGSTIGDEGMLSQGVALGSSRLEGVRGAGARSSDRDATRSSDGLDDACDVEVRLVRVGDEVRRVVGWWVKGGELNEPWLPAADLRSV